MRKLSSLFAHCWPVVPVICLCVATSNTPGKNGAATKNEEKHHGVRRSGPLTKKELEMARVAWTFFENNTQETGMANAVNDYPSTTMWDTASYLAATVSAVELGIIDKNDFDRRMMAILATMNKLDFFRGELPNKAYQTKTAEKVDYTNKPGEIGFSAIDLGRLLIWLKIIKERYPIHSNGIDNFVLRWKFCNVVDACGTLYGAILNPAKETQYVQEGRLGYEEYAAKGFQLWGFRTDLASRPEPYDVIPIYGVDVPYDTRDPRQLAAHNYVLSESYILDGIEMNWDLASDRTTHEDTHSDTVVADFAQRIFQVQKNRYQKSGILTARSEHQLAGPPYFVYDTIYSDGYPWNTITDEGKFVPEHAAIASKAAMGLWVLWNDEYTDVLFQTVSDLYDPKKGFYEGRYEKSGSAIKAFTANNNGIILETLLFKVQGKLLRFGNRPSPWDAALQDDFEGRSTCLPQFVRTCGGVKRPH